MAAVEELVKYFALTNLRKQKVLPKETLFSKIPTGGFLPKLARDIRFEKYNLFIRQLVSQLLFSQDNLSEAISNVVSSSFFQTYNINENDYTSLFSMVKEHFTSPVTSFDKIQNSSISGSPLCLHNNCVYSIITTGKFNSVRSRHIMLSLAYFCLCKQNGMEVVGIGLILPAQNQILVHDLSNWNWDSYWNKLLEVVAQKEERDARYNISPDLLNDFLHKIEQHVGRHIPKNEIFPYFDKNMGQQIFISNNRSLVVTVTDEFRTKMQQLSSQGPGRVYVHSPYLINLSKPFDEYDYTSESLINLLKESDACGCRGLVVHCGKRAGLSEEEAVANMAQRVQKYSGYATEQCPILIETSSGQGGETLCSPDELISFYQQVIGKPHPKVKICVDTCHVFAAGFDPAEYISQLVSSQIPIGLIHFNDSKEEKGSRKDRHESIGKGRVGYLPLIRVLNWALENSVDCVREY